MSAHTQTSPQTDFIQRWVFFVPTAAPYLEQFSSSKHFPALLSVFTASHCSCTCCDTQQQQQISPSSGNHHDNNNNTNNPVASPRSSFASSSPFPSIPPSAPFNFHVSTLPLRCYSGRNACVKRRADAIQQTVCDAVYFDAHGHSAYLESSSHPSKGDVISSRSRHQTSSAATSISPNRAIPISPSQQTQRKNSEADDMSIAPSVAGPSSFSSFSANLSIGSNIPFTFGPVDVSDPTPQQQQGIVFQRTKSVMAALPQRWSQALSPRSPCAPHFSSSNSPLLCLSPVNAEEDKLFGIMEPCEQKHVQQLEEKMQQIQVAMQSLQSASSSTTVNNSNSNESQSVVSSPYVSPYASPSVDPLLPSSNAIQAALQSEGDTYRAIRESQLRLKANSGGDYSPSLEYVHMPSNSIHAEQQYYTMQDGCWYKIFVQIPVQCQCKCGAAAVEEFARDEPLAGSAASSATPSPTAASAASAASITSSQHKHLVRISVRFGVSIPTRDFAKEALNIFQANSLYQTICKAFPITSQYPSSPGMSTSPPQANSPPLACSPISDSNRPSASRAKLPPDFYPPSNWRLIRCPDDIQPDCSILLLKQLTMPTYKHLSNAGIESISQLANLTPAQLAALKGVPKLSHLQESASAVLRAIVAHQTRFATAHQSVPFVVLAQSKHDSVSLGNFANISSPTVLELSSRGAWMGHGQQASFPSIDLLLHSLMASSSARNPAPPANSSSHMQVNGARVTSSMLGSSANSSSAVRPNCHSPSLNNNGWSPRSGEETDRSVISPRSSSIASEQDEFHQQQLMQQGGGGGGGFMNPQPQLYNNNNQMSNQSVASKDPTAAIVLATKDMAMTDATSQRPDQQQQQQQQAQSSQLPMLVQRVASPVSSNSVTATATSPHHQFQSPPARVVSPSMLAASRRSSFNSSSSTPTPSVMQFNQLHQNRGAAQSRRTEPPFHVLDQLKRQGCFHSSEPVSSAASINLNNWAEKVFREAWSSFLQFGNHYSAVVPVSAPVSGAGGGVGPGGNGSDQLMVDYFIKRSDFLAKGGFILNGGHEYILTANELALLWDLVLLPHNASNPNSPTNPPNHPQQTGVERGECVLYFSLYVRLYTWMYSTAPLEGDEAAAEPNSPLSPQSQNTIASPHSPYQLQSPRAPVSSQSQDDSVQSPPSASFPTRAPLLIDLRSLLSFLQTHITWLREYCTAFGLSLFSNRMEAERDLTTYAQWKRGPFVRIRFCEGRYDRWLQDQVEHEIGLPDFSISSTDELSDVENIVLNSSPASRSPSSPTLASSPRRKFVYRELRDRRQPLHRQLIASLCKVNVDGSYIPNEFIHHALLVQDDRNHSRGMLSSNNGGGGGSNASVVASPINSNNRSVYLLCLDGHTVCNSFQYLNQEAELIGTLKERLVEDELIAKVNQVSFHLVGIQPHASPNDQPSELNAKRKFVQQYCRYHGGPFNPTIPQMDFNRMQQGQQLSPNHVQRQLQQQQQQQQPQQPQQMQNPPSHQQHSQSLYRPPSDVRNPQLHNSSNMLMTSASVPNLHLNRQQPQQQQQQQQQNPIALPSHMSYPNQQQHQQGNARGHNMRIPQAFAGQGSYPQNQFAANQVPMQQQAQSGFPFQQHAQQAAYAMNQQPHVPSLVLPPLAPLAALSLNNNQADPLSTRGNAPNYSEGVNPGSNGPYNSFVVPSVLSPHSAARHAQLLAAQQQQQQPQVSQHQYDHDASGEYYRSAAQSYRPGMHATSFNDQQQQQNEVELQSTVALLQQQLREQEELSRQLQEQQHWQQQQQLAQQHQQHPGQQQYYNNYSSAQEQQQQQQQQQHPVQHSQHYDANLLYNSNSSLSTTSPANAGVSYAAVPAVPVVAAVVSKSASTSKLPSVQPSAGRKARSNNNSGDANASGSASTTTSADVLARRLIQTTIEDHRNNTNNNGSRVGVAAAPAAAAATTTATTTTTSVKKRKAVASKRSSNPPQTTASAAGNNNATPSVVTPPSPSNRQLKPSRAAIEKQTKLAPIDTNLSPTAAGTTAVSAFRFNSSSSNMLLATNTNSPVSASSPAAAASASGSNDSFAAARSLIHNTAHRGHKMLQEQKANLRKKTLQPLSSTSGSPASLAPRDSGTGNGSTNAHHDLHPGVFTSKALDRHSGSGGGFLMLTPSSQGLHGNSPQSGFLSLDSPSSLGLGGGLGQSLSRSGLTPKAKRLQQRRPSHDTPKQHELLLQAGLDVGASPAGNMYQEAAERAGASAVRPLRSQTGMLDLSPAPSSLRNSGSSGIDAMFITKSSSISINSSQHGDSLGMEWNS